jgi:hypothetical protein
LAQVAEFHPMPEGSPLAEALGEVAEIGPHDILRGEATSMTIVNEDIYVTDNGDGVFKVLSQRPIIDALTSLLSSVFPSVLISLIILYQCIQASSSNLPIGSDIMMLTVLT